MTNDETIIRDYLKAKNNELYTPAKIIGGKMFRVVNGLVSEGEFQAANKVEMRPKMKSLENPDRKTVGIL